MCLVVSGRVWGCFAFAPSEEKLPRNPRGAPGRPLRFAPLPALRSTSIPREFFLCLRSAKQPQPRPATTSHKLRLAKHEESLHSHFFGHLRGRLAGSYRVLAVAETFSRGQNPPATSIFLGWPRLAVDGSFCGVQKQNIHASSVICVAKKPLLKSQPRVLRLNTWLEFRPT